MNPLIEWEKQLTKSGDGTFQINIDDKYRFKLYPTLDIHLLKAKDPTAEVQYLVWGDGAFTFWQTNKKQLLELNCRWWKQKINGVIVRPEALDVLVNVVDTFRKMCVDVLKDNIEKDYIPILTRIETEHYSEDEK